MLGQVFNWNHKDWHRRQPSKSGDSSIPNEQIGILFLYAQDRTPNFVHCKLYVGEIELSLKREAFLVLLQISVHYLINIRKGQEASKKHWNFLGMTIKWI